MSIAITPPAAASRRHARTGGQRKLNGNSTDTPACRWPATPTPTTWRTSAGCWPTVCRSSRALGGGLLEPAGAESPEGRPPAGRLCEGGGVDRPGRSLAEVLEMLGSLRENQVEVEEPQGVHRAGQRHGASHAAPGSRSSASGSPSFRTAPWGGPCCTWLSYSRRWSGSGRWWGWSGSRRPASISTGARGSAGRGPRRYRTCAGAPASHGAAAPRYPGPPQRHSMVVRLNTAVSVYQGEGFV